MGGADGGAAMRDTRTRLVVLAPLRVEASAARRGAPTAEVVITGMGPVRSGQAVRGLANQAHSDGASSGGAMAIMGFGGALQAGMAPGDVVVATKVIRAGGGGAA
ncbi:MAG: 4-hydroxy-3-methylbut-2-enyl diphosphate reductase, partial [Acidimicrobiales bacterium]